MIRCAFWQTGFPLNIFVRRKRGTKSNRRGKPTYTLNRIIIRPILKKTHYELYKGRKPNISHLRVFGCKCFVLNNNKDSLGKFDARADEAILLSYSLHSKAYRVFTKRTLTVEESVHVVCDETNSYVQDNSLEEDARFQEKRFCSRRWHQG